MSENLEQVSQPQEKTQGWIDETAARADSAMKFISDYILSIKEHGGSAKKYDTSTEFQIRGEQDDGIMYGTLIPKEVNICYENGKATTLYIRYHSRDTETEISLCGRALDDYLKQYT